MLTQMHVTFEMFYVEYLLSEINQHHYFCILSMLTILVRPRDSLTVLKFRSFFYNQSVFHSSLVISKCCHGPYHLSFVTVFDHHQWPVTCHFYIFNWRAHSRHLFSTLSCYCHTLTSITWNSRNQQIHIEQANSQDVHHSSIVTRKGCPELYDLSSELEELA